MSQEKADITSHVSLCHSIQYIHNMIRWKKEMHKTCVQAKY